MWIINQEVSRFALRCSQRCPRIGQAVLKWVGGCLGLMCWAPTWGIAFNDRQVVQLEGCIASAAGEPNYVVLPIVDKLGALLDVDVVSANIKHYSNVALVLREGRGTHTETLHEIVFKNRAMISFLSVFRSHFYLATLLCVFLCRLLSALGSLLTEIMSLSKNPYLQRGKCWIWQKIKK